MSEIAQIRAEYFALHNEVLDLARDEIRNRPALDRLQIREQEIVDRLKMLGASVYPSSGKGALMAHAALSTERIGTSRRDEACVVEMKPVEERSVRRATGLFQPIPDVPRSLRAVADHAGRNDVIWFGETALCYWNDVIPAVRGRRAICTSALKFFKYSLAGHRRNRFHAATASRGPVLSSISEPLIPGVKIAGRGIGASSALPGMNVGEPRGASGAPFQSQERLGAPFSYVWPRCNASAVSTYNANIAPSIEAGPIDLETLDRARMPALTADFLASGASLDISSIGGPHVFRRSHATTIAGLSKDVELPRRLLDGVEHNGFPGRASQ